MKKEQTEILQKMADKHGTPMFVVDHEIIRQNYREFTEKLPDVQAYFAIKSNSHPDVLKTMYDLGSSFDVSSIQEFRMVYKNIKHLSEKERMEFVWEKCLMSDYDKTKVVSLFNELNFKSLVNRLPDMGSEKEIIDIFI